MLSDNPMLIDKPVADHQYACPFGLVGISIRSVTANLLFRYRGRHGRRFSMQSNLPTV